VIGGGIGDLLPGVRYDFHDVATVDGGMSAFATVTVPVLLLSGTTSPAFPSAPRPAPRHPARRHRRSGPRRPVEHREPHAVATALTTFFACTVGISKFTFRGRGDPR